MELGRNPISCKMDVRTQPACKDAVVEAPATTKANDKRNERAIQENHAHAKIIPLGKRTKKNKTRIIVAKDTDDVR